MAVLGKKLVEESKIDTSSFLERHIGLDTKDISEVLKVLGLSDLEEFISAVVPGDILDSSSPTEFFPEGCSESQALEIGNPVSSLMSV